MTTPATTNRVRRTGGVSARRGVRAIVADLIVLAIILVVAAATVLLAEMRTSPRPSDTISTITGGAPGGTPAELKAAAAQLIAQAVTTGGTGYRFEIVQRSTITARQGGPQVPIPDPVDPRGKPIGLTDQLYLIGLVETGYVRPDGFSMEMRSGPQSPDAKVELAGGDLLFRALVKANRTYRNDGKGWYETDRPPGVGLDPRTASLLPRFLERSTNAFDTDKATIPSELGIITDPGTRAIQVDGDVADLPGVVAVDGQPFTVLTGPVTMTFDAAGRLSGLIVRARNTNLDTFDLIVVTEVAVHYDSVPESLPDPVPALSSTAAETQP